MEDVVMGSFVGFMVGLLCCLVIVLVTTSDRPNTSDRRQAICDYLGGTVHGDVCIKDGKVVTINLKDK